MKLLMIFGVCCISTLHLTAQGTKKTTTALKPAASAKPTAKPVVKKIAAAVPFKNGLDSLSYAVGLSLANFYKEMGVGEVNSSLVLRALNDVKNGKPQFTEQQANACITGYIQNVNSEKASGNKKEGEAFLAENKKKPGVVTTPSGLQYTIIKEGTGAKPTSSDQVKVHYTGKLLDGYIFDSSVQRGEPIVMNVSQFISGWIEALQMMPVGSKWQLFIPSDLGYGDRGSGAIKPGSTLVFDIELLDIVK